MRPDIPYLENTPQNYYQLAWAERLKFVQGLIDAGEDSPYRITRILERHEARHNLGLEVKEGSFRDEQTGAVLETIEVFTGHAEWVPVVQGPAENLLPTGVAAVSENSFNGQSLLLPAYADIKGIAAEWVIDMVEDGCDAIVELGCGFGRNLFNIHLAGGPRGIPYFAAEYTESGRELAGVLAALEPAIDMRVAPFDHGAADLSFLEGCKRPLVFTCHSIEQIKDLPADYFQILAGAAPEVTCLHFEPFGFQLGDDDTYSKRQREMFTDRGWNQNFLAMLQQAANDGTVKVSHIFKDIIPNEASSPTSVAIWRNF
jgi:hypothetical protein